MRSTLGHIPRFIVIAICFIAMLLVANLSPTSAQPSPETWMDLSKQPLIEESWDTNRSNLSSIGPSTYRPSCRYDTYLKRNFTIGMALWRQSVTGCWQSSHLGEHTVGSSPWLATGPIAGKITNLDGTQQIQPIPRSGVLLETRRGSSRPSYTRFVYGARVTTSRGLLGTVSHTYLAHDAFSIEYESGVGVIPQGTGLNYSKNGRYAVGVNNATAMFRIDLDKRKILNFGLPIPHGAGWDPMMAISITDDGRYAVAAGTAHAGNQWVRIYDLTKCKDGEYNYVNSQHADCEYRDITQYIKDNFVDFGRFSMAEFGDDFTLFIYNLPTDPSKPAKRYMLRAPNAPSRASSYIALGDSFASGEGAGNYFKGTDEGPNINNCHLSRNSYPYLIGKRLKINNHHSVACSGARIHNVIGLEDRINKSLSSNSTDWRTNQYLHPDEVPNNELKEQLPGYNPQIKAIQMSNPDTITISMVGNDIGFADKVRRCLEPDTCYDTYEDRVEILREIRGKFDALVDMYDQLLDAGGPSLKVYVIGYPKVGISTGSCAINVRLNSTELEFADLLVSELNNVIKQAARKAGVLYVDVEDAFVNHRLCENNSHLVALNGLTLGNDIARIIGNESYHPNVIGHRLLTDKILEQTSNFTKRMPAPNPSAAPSQQEDDLLFLNQPKSSRRIYSTNYYAGLSNDILYKNIPMHVKVEEDYRKGYKPYSLVGIFIYSEPTQVGSASANDDGTISTEITIPDSIAPGFHTLHFFGQDIENNPIDFYKTVYVAHSEDDKNGNGIKDIDEPCGVFEASGKDLDQDGTDDACDPFISEQPVSVGENKKETTTSFSSSAEDSSAVNTPSAERTAEDLKPLLDNHERFIKDMVLGSSQNDTPNDNTSGINPPPTPWSIINGVIAVVILTIFVGLRYSKQ